VKTVPLADDRREHFVELKVCIQLDTQLVAK